MENSHLSLVEQSKKKRNRRRILLIVILAILACGVVFCGFYFSVEDFAITGNTTYTEEEIRTAVTEEDYVPNTLVMMAQNRIFGQRYLPFVEKMTMTMTDSHTLKIKVKEKIRAGVFEYMGKHVYFDSDGIAQESRNYLFPGVPIVTGVDFSELVLGEEIPVDGNYFDTILSITKKISTYDLDISEIRFDGENDITLVSGKFNIYLGSTEALDGKMSKIKETLAAVSKERKKGTIDMSLYTDERNIITYRKKRQ